MPGSSHDARAFGMCALWEAIQLGFIARGFYLLGDAAYRGICEFSALRIGWPLEVAARCGEGALSSY
jgi:hypothetical protein